LAFLVVICPISVSNAQTFDWSIVISEYRHYEPPFTISDNYFMLIYAGVFDTNTYPVYVQNIPNISGDSQLNYIPGWDYLNQHYSFAGAFGSPIPGVNWENRTYTFYIDLNQNGQKDTGEPTTTSYIPQASISQMGLVQNVSISDGYHPTITWDPAPNAETYRIRFVPIKNGNPDLYVGLFQSDKLSGSPSYSFTYTGDLFNEYNALAVVIEAWEDYNDLMLNRSRYITQHDIIQPVPFGPNVTEVTGDDRANAVVTLGSVVTGGDQMALVMNFPPHEAAVDIYAGVQLPNGSLYLVKSDGSLTMDLVPYGTGVDDAQSATILDSFDVCMPFGTSVPTGTWNVYSVVAPTNGGNFSAIDFTSGDYDLWFYSFDVTCP